MSRKLENWIQTWMSWTLPRLESPESFVLWTGLFAISSVLKRKVFIPRDYLGSWECYPNLFIMFIGPPGTVRKTTAIRYFDELIENNITNITRASHAVSQQVLSKNIADDPECSVSISAEELAPFLNTSKDLMLDFLTTIYDGRKDFKYETFARGLEYAEKPCLNALFGSTPIWIGNNLSEAAIGGGFMSRVISIFEDQPRTRQMYYNHLLEEFGNDYFINISKDLVHDLLEIDTLNGPFKIDEEALKWMENWYRSTADSPPIKDHRLASYFQRKPAHVHKVAMLLKVARSNELILEVEDFEQAIFLLENTVEKQLVSVYKNIGKNPYAVDMDLIRKYIAEFPEGIDKPTILKHFQANAEPHKVAELVEALCIFGDVDVIQDGDNMKMRINKNEK